MWTTTVCIAVALATLMVLDKVIAGRNPVARAKPAPSGVPIACRDYYWG